MREETFLPKLAWTRGRQGTGYFKALLAHGKHWDLYLLKYPSGSYVPEHVDPLDDGQEHYRANLVLWGEQTYVGDALFRLGPLVIFRPDLMAHSVAESVRSRYVLSLGWARNTK